MKYLLFAIIAAFGMSTSAMACPGNGESCPLSQEECQKQHPHGHCGKAMACDNAAKSCPLSKEECQKKHKHAKSMDPETKAAWKAKKKERMNEFFEKADTNHDGQLSKEEFLAAKKQYRGKGNQGKGK